MSTYEEPKVRASGGYVLYVELCEGVSLKCNELVHKLYYILLSRAEEGMLQGVRELVPAYSSLTIFYDPRLVSANALRGEVLKAFKDALTMDLSRVVRPKEFRIPVVYGGEWGPDLESVAELSGLSVDEVIKIHTSRTYTCYMLGFTPGFIYLGEVDDRIAVPRLERPRLKVPAGSVGIAGKQTGVYGVESPGGWRLIGRTPLKMFDPLRTPPTPIRPGDKVRFYEVGEEEFRRLKGMFLGEVIS